jgi:prevent-host-death family protein
MRSRLGAPSCWRRASSLHLPGCSTIAATWPAPAELLDRDVSAAVMTSQSLAAVKAHFSQVIDEVSGTHERVTVTKNGSPVAVILAVEDYESLSETLRL